MKLAFLGDSITEGVGASAPELCYVSQVGKMLGCEVINYGMGGTRIARKKEGSIIHRHDIDFNLRTALLDKTVDRIFVFGGTNDMGHGDAVMGEKGDLSVYTFHGAVNTLFTTLIDMYGKEKVVVILPMQRWNMNVRTNPVTGKHLKEYVQIIKEYVNLYNLKCIDLFNEGLPEPPEGQSEYFVDGLHPNDKGYNFIAEKICEFIKNDK